MRSEPVDPVSASAEDAASAVLLAEAPPVIKKRPTTIRRDEISFEWNQGKHIVELVNDPALGLGFAIWENGAVRYAKEFRGQKPLAWINAFAQSNSIRLPSKAEEYGSLNELAERIRTFIHQYFDCDAPFESVLVLFILHTWIYEKFHAVPYLRFIGLPGSGKTRGSEVVGALAYHPIVTAGSQTSAPMFRMIEAAGGTLLIDEADFANTGIGTDIVKILNSSY